MVCQFPLNGCECQTLQMRLSGAAPDVLTGTDGNGGPFGSDFDRVLGLRRQEAEEFYATVIPASLGAKERRVMRQALAGMFTPLPSCSATTWNRLSVARATATGSNAVSTSCCSTFTWWVNGKERSGRNVFEGGFLGLDNIGVFDRSAPLPTGGYLEQADGTAWMALFCQNMQDMAIELGGGRTGLCADGSQVHRALPVDRLGHDPPRPGHGHVG
jgi:hypothetical protein